MKRPGYKTLAAVVFTMTASAILLTAVGVMASGSRRAAEAEVERVRPASAARYCDPGVYTAVVIDDGRALLIEEGVAADRAAVECLLDQFDAPAVVTAQIEQTRPLDGRQTAQWPGYRASWTYDAGNGLNMIIEVES